MLPASRITYPGSRIEPAASPMIRLSPAVQRLSRITDCSSPPFPPAPGSGIRARMECILVTGGCGFIGVNFIRHVLEETGFDGVLVNLDKLTYAANPLSLADLEGDPRYRFVRADLCDRDAVDRVFADHPVDAVVHFAAESHVDRSIRGPGAFIHTNIVGTFHLLEAARAAGSRLKRFHHVSTDEVFGSLGETGFFTEDTPYHPNSPYSASKAASDHLVRAYAHTYGLPVTLTNCSNNYGPYQFPEKLIPLMILNALEGRPLPVYGDGQNVRDWLYVRDHATAVWRVLTQGQDGRTYNVGGINELPNLEVVHRIADLVDELAGARPEGPRRGLVTFVPDRPGHDRRYAIDCRRIQEELGWRPEESFDTGLRRTVAWYLDRRDWVEQVRSGEYQTWIETHYGAPAEGVRA